MEEFVYEILEKKPLTPQQMLDILREKGYIGQTQAAKAICLMAYRHINRIRKLHRDLVPPEKLPSKDNYLLIGPTGCGKTYLIELLFKNILNLPTTIVDITNFSETGYVGQDLPSMLTRLIHEAQGDVFLASLGIVCIDEFDKISSGQNNAVFSGAGTTKDVTGMGVQRELLKMLEDADIDVGLEITHSSYGQKTTFNTSNVTFVACGAFSGFQEMLQAQSLNIGFSKANTQKDAEQKHLRREDVEKAANFQSYGIMPELIGRFARVIPFTPLSAEELKKILNENTIVKYQRELLLDQIQLEVEDAIYDWIVDKCQTRGTGARGLKSYVVEYLEEACFEVYSSDKKNIRLFVEQDTIQWAVH